ncbi:MAG: hypothetical protein HYZ11_11415 [Candidatus Tectomicrobia bacterium]|uniref:Uncharacterized protein n=1 Tax=Tectimicrobiota bacterium TaxID=2528274 RepID=A0A932HYT5_UNCTE|nr:hypothetical protein [Candidatus Tectomicrobia bacterium]
MPEKDRNLLFLLGHIANENIILQKLLLMCIPAGETEKTQEESWAVVTQSLLIAKVLVSKLFEAWNKVGLLIFNDKLFEGSLFADMPQYGKDALTELKRYFGQNNHFCTVRNKLTFHYDIPEIKKSFESLPETDELAILLGERNGNCLYYLSEVVMMETLVDRIYGGGREAAVNKFFDDLNNCSSYFGYFMQACMTVLIERNFEDKEHKEIEVVDPPSLDSIKIPFFVHVGDESSED